MKKKMSTNVLTRWLKGWVSQTHQVENNDNTILDVFSVSENLKSNSLVELESFKFADVIYVLLNWGHFFYQVFE